jgi:hypothetical protein
MQACAAKTRRRSRTSSARGLGRVVVVVLESKPKDAGQGPTRFGGVGGGVVGTAQGVGISLLSAVGCFITAGYWLAACISTVMTPYWIGRGAVEGAMKSMPESERRASQAAIAAAIEDLDLQQLARTIEEERYRRSAAGPEDASEAIKTVAEITLLRLGLERRPSSSGSDLDDMLKASVPDVDPLLELVAEVRLRLVPAVGAGTLFERTYIRLSGPSRKFAEWARDAAAEFRSARDEALDGLARDIADELFGAERPARPPAEEPMGEPAPAL